jgi:hypothetical protein
MLRSEAAVGGVIRLSTVTGNHGGLCRLSMGGGSREERVAPRPHSPGWRGKATSPVTRKETRMRKILYVVALLALGWVVYFPPGAIALPNNEGIETFYGDATFTVEPNLKGGIYEPDPPSCPQKPHRQHC